MNQFAVRDYDPSDKNFVYSTWLKGLYFGNEWFKEIPEPVFLRAYQRVLESIMALPQTKVAIACLPDVTDVILGYAVYQDQRLHWVFVKNSWRNLGIATAIVPKDITQCSHLTHVGLILKRKKGLIFNPFFTEQD